VKIQTPEFSRPLNVDRVPRTGSHERLTAEPAECAALAKRLDLPMLYSLTALLKAQPWRGGGLKLSGDLEVDLDQTSVVSAEVFRTKVKIPVLSYFLSPKDATYDGDEDAEPIVNGHIDLGEILAEILSVELDPYPRKPGEVFVPIIEDIDDPSEPSAKVSPFAALKRL
jgi:uncharacterized metal-binding protein YceD (DUF177 family)